MVVTAMTVNFLFNHHILVDDNWILECLKKKAGENFYGGDIFALVHENTEKRLKMSRYYEYSFNNW